MERKKQLYKMVDEVAIAYKGTLQVRELLTVGDWVVVLGAKAFPKYKGDPNKNAAAVGYAREMLAEYLSDEELFDENVFFSETEFIKIERVAKRLVAVNLDEETPERTFELDRKTGEVRLCKKTYPKK